MKAIALTYCLLTAPVLAVAASDCSKVDIPVAFTISATYTDPTTGIQFTSAIQPDGRGEYVNGQDVIALIHVCNGSYAVTVNPNGGPRTLTYDFTKKVNTTSLTPAWTNAPLTTANTFISFSNIYYEYAANATYGFTTYMNEVYLPDVPNGPYYASMENAAALAPTSPISSNITPCPNSLVNVVHYPATISPAAPEHWVVWSDGSQPQSCSGGNFLQVGSLTFNSKGHTQDAGEYSLPFYMTIRKLP